MENLKKWETEESFYDIDDAQKHFQVMNFWRGEEDWTWEMWGDTWGRRASW